MRLERLIRNIVCLGMGLLVRRLWGDGILRKELESYALQQGYLKQASLE